MVGIVIGSGLGLFNSSLDTLGLATGQSSFGQAKGSAFVNIATGNLSVQFLDETLSGSGADLGAYRTYNAVGPLGDGDVDGWRWMGEKRVTLQSGSINGVGSTILRTLGDGSRTTFTYNGTAYISTDGAGAHDTITWDGANSEWIYNEDTANRNYEYYSGPTAWIKRSYDSSGNEAIFAFTGDKLASVTDTRTRQRFDFIYNGFNGRLSEINTLSVTSAVDAGTLLKQVGYTYNGAGMLESVIQDLTPTNSSDNTIYTTTYSYNATNKLIS